MTATQFWSQKLFESRDSEPLILVSLASAIFLREVQNITLVEEENNILY